MIVIAAPTKREGGVDYSVQNSNLKSEIFWKKYASSADKQ
jgi:hypothetical protein